MKLFFSLAALLLSLALSAQSAGPTLAAVRIETAPRIDGELTDEVWSAATTVATDFTNLQPVAGQTPAQRSEVRVLYDDRGLYVGATLFDAHPDSIQTEITERDDLGNTDWFGLAIDPYRSGQNGFEFITTPLNVQYDAQMTARGGDENWDAVWISRAALTAEGWSVEIFIPYSAIRFPTSARQEWGINFYRTVRRNQEKSFWSAIDPNTDGFLNQAGTLTDLENIQAPPRIQATPFLAVYGSHLSDPVAGKPSLGSSVTGGMDVKVGLSDAFTLDMTLIPDFGEARSDNQILNLGPFEQRFDEQRAFFTEGTELFNKGGYFYSRRVGGRNFYGGRATDGLTDDETVVSNPQRASLYNATKITGRTAAGTGVGFFNAVEQRNSATIRSEEGEERSVRTNPLTNYNVMVVDQNLKNNSSVTLINTNVLREGAATDANVTGLLFDLHNGANKYAIRGNLGVSQRFMPGETERGHVAELHLARISGAWNWRVGYEEESDTYNPNDLGLLFSNNSRSWSGNVNYNRYQPFWNGRFLSGGGGVYARYERLNKPSRFTDTNVEAWVYAQTKGFWRLNFWSDHSLTDAYDFFEPRVKGRFWRSVGYNGLGGFVSSDQRKRIQLSGNFNYSRFREAGRDNLRLFGRVRYRASDRLSIRVFAFTRGYRGDIGYVNQTSVNGVTDVYFGHRRRREVEAGLEGKYSFNANMTLNLRARHYWSGVRYDRYSLLATDGNLVETDYVGNHDQDFDAFNIDLIYRWRFAPGSDIFFVYKTNVTDFDAYSEGNYFGSLRDMWRDTPRQSTVSLKIIYWLDYSSLFR